MTAPRRLTPLQQRIVIALSLFIAITRLAAVARSLFDWDEALFSLAVHEFDVAASQPHPPGYPLFVAAAKLVHLSGADEFRSLQVITLLGAWFLFPALFALAREIGFDFATAVCGSAVFAFLPNVWVYGGTGFSDVPAAAVVFAACALLLRGRSDRRAYIAGACLLGIAAGFRPPALVIGFVPAVLSTWRQVQLRAWRTIFAAAMLGALIVGVSYGSAALASRSIDAYADAVQIQSTYVREVDSWRNPNRGPLAEAAKNFFIWPIDERAPMLGLALLAAVSLVGGLVKARRPPFLTLGIFAPVAVFAWLNLDIQTVSRYAISYMAMHTLLAADGVRLIVRRSWIQAAVTASAVAGAIVWIWPAIRVQQTMPAPPAAALGWVHSIAAPSDVIYVHGGLGPQAAYLLGERGVVFFENVDEIALLAPAGWIVDVEKRRSAEEFAIPRNALWDVLRRRNFEIFVSRTEGRIRFEEGWYDEERDGELSWRWMGEEGRVSLPPVSTRARLSIALYIPIDTLAEPPDIDVYLNGDLVERMSGAGGTIDRAWDVDARHDRINDLRIVTSATVSPARISGSSDTRELGLRVNALEWGPAPP